MPTRFTTELRTAKRAIIAHGLAEHAGNRTQTARALGLTRSYLCRLIRELGLPRNPPAGPRRTDVTA